MEVTGIPSIRNCETRRDEIASALPISERVGWDEVLVGLVGVGVMNLWAGVDVKEIEGF
jgi:hypothetical protein